MQTNTDKHFALIGVSGYIAPRHLRAMADTGNQLTAALDPSDAAGVLDSYFPDADFFTEFERFDRHLEKLRRGGKKKLDYIAVCSPNYLHDAHIRFGLRIGADVICEKPLVLNPWNIEALETLSEETGRRINIILQLRLHPIIQQLKQQIQSEPAGKKHEIELAYIAPRGRWYDFSWKGDVKKSGGIATNIGVHFFDMLSWIFGPPEVCTVHLYNARRAAGLLELEKARVKWFLSVNRQDLPECPTSAPYRSWRRMTVDGREVDFSGGFEDLHTESYRRILNGFGFGPVDTRPSIEIVSQIRTIEPVGVHEDAHPMLLQLAAGHKT